MSFSLDDFRVLFMEVAILKTKTQEEPRMLYAAAHTSVEDGSRRSYFVVQADLNTLRNVLDKARKILKRSQVVGFFVHGYFFLTIVETKAVSAGNGVEGE